MRSETTLRMWQKMCENKYFELAFKNFIEETGKTIVKIPFYLSIGQEAVSAALATVFPEAVLFPQHRCHGIYLAWGGDPEALADELMGLPTGCVGGKGGSASIHIPGKMIGHDGFMGTEVPDGVGRALRAKILKLEERSVIFMGDASGEEGYVLGSEGFASTKKVPALFVSIDNNFSVETEVKVRRNWTFENVARAFGMETVEMTDNPWTIMNNFRSLRGNLPALFNIHICRHISHAGIKEEKPEWDRFLLVKEELARIGLEAPGNRVELEAKAKMNGVWHRRLAEFKKTYVEVPQKVEEKKLIGKTCAQTIAEITKKHLLEKRGVAGGQCLAKGGWLYNSIPELTEEEGILEASMDDTSWPGILVGMASSEFRPIIIIRIGGFLWYNALPVANRAGLSKYMWNEPRPVLVRAVSRDGFIGPVASGSHYSLLTRMPGVNVYAPMTPKEYEYAYDYFMNHDDPMLLHEHIKAFSIDYEMENIVREKADLAIFAVSSTRLSATEALNELEKERIICNLIHVRWLKPFEVTEEMYNAIQNSKHGGLFLDGDFENSHLKCMAYDLMCATGRVVRVLGRDEHPAGFSPESDSIPPTKEKIIKKVKKILMK